MFLRVGELIIYNNILALSKLIVKGRNKFNTFFRVILTRKYIPYIIFMIQVIFSVKKSTSRSSNRKVYFYQIKLRTCVIPHFHGLLTGRSFYGIMVVIEGDFLDQ